MYTFASSCALQDQMHQNSILWHQNLANHTCEQFQTVYVAAQWQLFQVRRSEGALHAVAGAAWLHAKMT